jgi:hypothetical protein
MPESPTLPSAETTAIALRFLADLQAGARPSIEAALDTVPTSEWPGLLQSLLIAEVNWRRARGESPTIREYLPRFPAHTSIVRSLFPDAPPISAAGTAAQAPRTVGPVPAAIVLQPQPDAPARADQTFAIPSGFAPRQRRRTNRWLLSGGAAAIGVAGVIVILSMRGNRPNAEPKPSIDGTAPAFVGARPKMPSPFDPKPGLTDPERELAEWVVGLGGKGTIAMEAGGRRPIGGEAPIPKARFAVAGVSLPPEAATRWKAADLKRFQGRAKLESIQLHHPTDLTDAAIGPLAGLPLRTLELRGDNVQVTGAVVAQFKDLETLALFSAPALGDNDLTAIGKLSRLSSLTLNCSKLSPLGMAELKSLPLRSLALGESLTLTAEHTRVLPAMTLEDFECHALITDDALLEFAVFPNMKRFRLRRANISDAGLKVVAGLGKLEEFQAVGSTISGAGLEHLSERKGLKVLDLVDGKLTDDSVGKLLALPALKELRLAGCPITDRSAMLLANLDQLEILDLGGTGITDTALAILKKHATLKQLIITGTKVSRAAISDFEQATPNCKVVYGRPR